MYRAFFKRLLDICGAIFLIVLTLPIMAVVAVLIYFKVSRDVIFTQARPGLHAKIFKIYKFKTMSDERGADGDGTEHGALCNTGARRHPRHRRECARTGQRYADGIGSYG